MGRRAWLWALGAGSALLLAAWVSGAGEINAFSPSSRRPWAEDRGDIFDQEGVDRASPRVDRSRLSDDDPLLTTILMWTLRALLVLVAAAILLVVLRALWRRLRLAPDPLKDEVRAEVLPDVLVAGVREGEAQLDLGSSSEAVINAWLALERAAVTVGIDDDRSRTPAELVRAVLGSHAVDPEAIERLASLYREARFSVHPIGEEHRAAARLALARVRADLTRPLGALGEVAER
ncbi:MULTISPECIES: DUF4129 domain-containing protein [unclassified Knoellia]|uniref:DUF4129 domain-containing protein n=1 Tax=Knoellia altitudinis TaxID=3404795 RepID=UPI00360DF5AA